jgi:hypothetical protein
MRPKRHWDGWLLTLAATGLVQVSSRLHAAISLRNSAHDGSGIEGRTGCGCAPVRVASNTALASSSIVSAARLSHDSSVSISPEARHVSQTQ